MPSETRPRGHRFSITRPERVILILTNLRAREPPSYSAPMERKRVPEGDAKDGAYEYHPIPMELTA